VPAQFVSPQHDGHRPTDFLASFFIPGSIAQQIKIEQDDTKQNNQMGCPKEGKFPTGEVLCEELVHDDAS
jgi:hypothetical protein